ncbi:MAG TPA: HD-GYP domain-containing protein [Vicinamibacterales bacterium]
MRRLIAIGSALASVRRSPRFVVRVMAASFLTVALVLTALFAVLLLHTREVVERGVVEHLEAAQHQLALFERDRQREAVLRATVVSENPTLKAALDTYKAELELGAEPATLRQVLATVQLELDKLAGLLEGDVIAVLDLDGHVMASAGPSAKAWRAGVQAIEPDGRRVAAAEKVVQLGTDSFRVTLVPVWLDDARLADLAIARVLDVRYAGQLAGVARSGVAIVIDGRLLTGVMEPGARLALSERLPHGLDQVGIIEHGGDRYAYRRLHHIGPASFYAVDSISGAARRVSHAALPKLVVIALGGLVLCALASARLAKTVSAPIDHVSREIAAMAAAQTTARIVVPAQSTHEIEALGDTFNTLMQSLQDARAETDAAYLGAIRALAAALDARDPYTAGHSERVSALSVAMARHMALDDDQVEVVRLGALLHDIGKIGISDTILGKPSPLTAEEYEAIKRHPMLGAQILRPVSFLERHIPIVELHHERPDGRGYPYGLRGDEIPLVARIVHVADAFDAMTSARAYRGARPAHEALAELWREAGSGFDVPSLQALAAVLPSVHVDVEAAPAPAAAAVGDDDVRGELLRFERRVS